jgi:hypothetical protein
MAFLRMSGLALAAVLGLSLPIGQASAMPANGLAVAVKQVAKPVENVRLVCGPYRCWSTGWGWRRPLYAYGGWGWRRPLYAYGGWGWRRPLYAYGGPAWGWRRPLYAYAGWHRPYAAWGWRRPYAYAGYAAPGWGWRRPYAYAGYAAPGWGWRRPYAGWGFNRPLYAFAGGPYVGYAGWRNWGYW